MSEASGLGFTPPSSSEKSFGEKIKLYRLSNNLDYGQVFFKTKISENFIISLEREDFSRLPAHAFSRGMLVTLLEIYGVAPQDRRVLIEEFSFLYHNHQSPPSSPNLTTPGQDREPSSPNLSSQDQGGKVFTDPIDPKDKEVMPESGGVVPSRSSRVITKIPGDEEDPHSHEKQLQENISSSTRWVVVILFIVLGLITFFYKDIQSWLLVDGEYASEISSASEEQRNESQGVYSLYNRFNTFDLVKDDIVKIFFNSRVYDFRLNDISSTFDNRFVVNFDINNERLIRIYLFEETWVDVDQDRQDDILVKFQKISGEVAIIFFSIVNEGAKDINYNSIWSYQEKVTIPKGETVLLKNQNKSPIQVYVKATTLPVHLAYNIDGQRQNVINLLPGNTVELLAHDHLELQIGNYRSVNLILNYIPLKFPVENLNQFSLTKIIKWLPSYRNETKYDLVIKDYIE